MNASRGPVVDEVALVEHLKANPMFRVGLDVFEVGCSTSAKVGCSQSEHFRGYYVNSKQHSLLDYF